MNSFSSPEKIVVKYSDDSVHEDVKAVDFSKGDILVFGRASQSDIVLDSPKVSRQHFRLDWTGEKPQLVDCGSLNGTKVNGSRVQGNKSLSIGDCIRVSGLAFHLLDPTTDEVRRLRENGQILITLTTNDKVTSAPNVQDNLLVAAGASQIEQESNAEFEQLSANYGGSGVLKLLGVLAACVALLGILLFVVS